MDELFILSVPTRIINWVCWIDDVVSIILILNRYLYLFSQIGIGGLDEDAEWELFYFWYFPDVGVLRRL